MGSPKKINEHRLIGSSTNRRNAGRKPRRDRLFVEAIFWILRTGSPWRDLPDCFPPWQSVYSRFRRWNQQGLWKRILASFHDQADTEFVMIDGTIVRAHQHANCARDQQDAQALGRSRGGLSTKLHWLCDSLGYPLGLIATAGQRGEATQANGLINQCPKRFEYLLADAGYDSDDIRLSVKQRGATAVIKPNPTRSQKPPFDKHIYKERHRIENLMAKLKNSRRLATRYDKSAKSYLAFTTLAAIKIWMLA